MKFETCSGCHPRLIDVVVGVLSLLVLSDLPVHLVDARRQIFLPRGMLGRVDCPVDANPPVTLTVWTKDERVIDVTRTTRFKVKVDHSHRSTVNMVEDHKQRP